jgi:hypothetical protein
MFCQSAYEFFQKSLYSNNRNYLEIGVFAGGSIDQLANLYPRRIIYAIDPFIEDGSTEHTSRVNFGATMITQRDQVHRIIKDRANLQLFETTSKQFADALTETQAQYMNVGSVLIDGSHHYEDVVIDGDLAMKLIGRNDVGYVVFDDLHHRPVQQAYQEFCWKYRDQLSEPITLQGTSVAGHQVNGVNGLLDLL